jgi:hypothetical protein
MPATGAGMTGMVSRPALAMTTNYTSPPFAVTRRR